MKPINEQRIKDLETYISSYYIKKGIYPTYREMKDDLHYSSLSLVNSDINRLKEKGFLIEDSYHHIKLKEYINQKQRRYDYPLIIMSEAANHVDQLCDEERKLLEAQDLFLKGNYKESQNLSRELIKESYDLRIIFAAKLTLCWSGIYTGEIEYWKDFFRMMIGYEVKDYQEKLEKEMMAHFLSLVLRNNENCPSWLKEGRFYDLRKEAIPLASLLFLSYSINQETSPIYLEPLCSLAALNHIDAIQVYMDFYLAMSYHYALNDEYLLSHVTAAVETCLLRGWLTPLMEVRKSLGSVMMPIIEKHDAKLVNKIEELTQQAGYGYNKLYESLVGENPTKNLTFREVEIVNYIRMDNSTKEIADKLYLSPETIKYYLSSIYLKLGVSGRKELQDLIKKAYQM